MGNSVATVHIAVATASERHNCSHAVGRSEQRRKPRKIQFRLYMETTLLGPAQSRVTRAV